MKEQFLGTALVLGLFVVSATADARASQTIDRALTSIGAGSAEEIKERLFSIRINRHTPSYRTAAREALPAHIRTQRITEGRLLRRVEWAIRPVLELHSRSDAVELVLFQDNRPYAMLFRDCVLVLSTGLAAALEDAELIGIVAHELGHAYFIGELALAHGAKDLRSMKVVELKCDAVAILTLKLLGHEAAGLLRGLRKMERVNERMLLSSRHVETHPSMVERGQFSERFSKFLRP